MTTEIPEKKYTYVALNPALIKMVDHLAVDKGVSRKSLVEGLILRGLASDQVEETRNSAS